MLDPIHEHLAGRHLLPGRQLVAAGYVAAAVLAAGRARFGGEVLGPTRGDFRWQARAQTGFEGHHCTIDWEARRAICPQGHTSRRWTPMQDRRQVHPRAMITVAFSVHDCRPLPSVSEPGAVYPLGLPRAHAAPARAGGGAAGGAAARAD